MESLVSAAFCPKLYLWNSSTLFCESVGFLLPGCCVVFHYMTILQFVYSFLWWWFFSSIWLLWINLLWTFLYKCFCRHMYLFFLGVEMVDLIYAPTALHERSSYFSNCPTVNIVSHFNFSHSDACVVVSCNFNLHFSDW